MMEKCKECYWWNGKKARLSNGKLYPCNNIGVDGWDHWTEHQMPPEHCTGYCKDGEYVPTGIWAGVAETMEAVAEIMERGA